MTNRARQILGRASRGLAMVCLLVLCACASGERVAPAVERDMALARYDRARAALARDLTGDRSDRGYILDRQRLLIATLADGDPHGAERIANETYDLLRVQGLNADRTTASIVLNEGVKIWKGEPFEQAMAYHYIALQKAMVGEWDNARAAAQSSLFLLKDFGDAEGTRLSTLDVAREAARRGESGGDEYLDHGYTPVKTDFTLGYLFNAIANIALGRGEEASDNLGEVARLDPGLAPLCAQLRDGAFNTVLVVDAGRGPAKVAYGPDNALARFQPRTPSDARPLVVTVLPSDDAGGTVPGPAFAIPPAHDVNHMAARHYWNNLEDVRLAKSAIGDALVTGGLIAASTANQRNRDARQNQQIIGLSVAALGLLMKSTAHADTRHVELLPQRVYVVPLAITQPGTALGLEVAGTGVRQTLLAIDPPRDGTRVRLLYARPGQAGTPAGTRVLYANGQYAASVEGDGLPYILGGRCVRRPTPALMDHYHASGNLLDMQWTDLENLYREEGIALSREDHPGEGRAHVLEGGTTLAEPLAGTVGYTRVFATGHPPYRPRSRVVRELAARIAPHAPPGNTR